MTPDLFPPGPGGIFSSFGNLLALKKDAPGFFTKLASEHGGAASFKAGGSRAYFFSEPDAVREMLVTRAASMRKTSLLPRVWKMFLGILGNGLLTSEGAFHDRQRKLIVPAFHRERLASYATTMTDAERAQTAAWTDGGTLDLGAELSRLTLVIAARTLFGADVSGNAKIISEAVTRFMEMLERGRSPFHRLTAKRTEAEYDQTKNQLDAAVSAIIAEHRQRGTDQGDLLSMLLLVRDEETGEPGMNDKEVRDEVMTLLIAGHETTTSALTSSFYLLAQNPAQEARLHAEIDEVLPDGRPPTFADLPRLAFTRRVFTEAMRLYPPAWAMLRRVENPVEVGGWKLPAGAMCIISPYVMHRDPRWFPEPEKFLPERWEEGQGLKPPKHAFLPFGSGSRSCAGEGFAWMEGILLIADIARHWRVRIPAGAAPPKRLPAATLRYQHGLMMETHRRA